MVLASVLMHIINFASHAIAQIGYHFTYSVDISGTSLTLFLMHHILYICVTHKMNDIDHDDWWNPTEVVLAVSIATAGLCFILLAINVDRLKLSRNALDLIVIRFKKELATTISQVVVASEKEIYQRREKEKAWRILETINLCRPLYRDHSLAIALADYELDGIRLPLLPSFSSMVSPSVPVTTSGVGPSSTSSAAAAAIAMESKAIRETEYLLPKARAASALNVYQQLCGSIQLTSPTPDAVVRDVRLEQLIRHPITLELFKDSMTHEVDRNILMLYLDIRRYKAITEPQFRAVMAREIFDSSIARGSRFEVNVGEPLRKIVESKVTYRPGLDTQLIIHLSCAIFLTFNNMNYCG
jgi:hypothetical protein